MSDFIQKIRKKFDVDFFVDDEKGERLEVISTGSLSLDVSTGIGGIPKGRLTVIYGAESSGKTTLCLEISRSALVNGDKVLYIDAEQSLDYNYVRAIIGEDIDLTNFIIAQPETAEQALTTAEYALNGNEKLGIEGGEFGLIIVDSIAALAPEKEKEKELVDKNVALISSVLSAFFRRNMYGLKDSNTALIMVNQVRDSIGTYYGGYTLTGGHALKHFSSMIIMLSSSSKLDVGGETIGQLSKFTVKKNKLAIPFKSYELPIVFGMGIDYHKDVIDFATLMGVIRRRGSFYVYEEENLGQGNKNASKYLEEHQETLDKIVKEVYTKVNNPIEKGEDDE